MAGLKTMLKLFTFNISQLEPHQEEAEYRHKSAMLGAAASLLQSTSSCWLSAGGCVLGGSAASVPAQHCDTRCRRGVGTPQDTQLGCREEAKVVMAANTEGSTEV
jgi:hypothetical protein